MWFAILAMRFLEALFFTGIIGSAIVVLITSVQDVQELIGGDAEQPHAAEKT
jgi:hypothetical protein